jgi:hypothetical protein
MRLVLAASSGGYFTPLTGVGSTTSCFFFGVGCDDIIFLLLLVTASVPSGVTVLALMKFVISPSGVHGAAPTGLEELSFCSSSHETVRARKPHTLHQDVRHWTVFACQ